MWSWDTLGHPTACPQSVRTWSPSRTGHQGGGDPRPGPGAEPGWDTLGMWRLTRHHVAPCCASGDSPRGLGPLRTHPRKALPAPPQTCEVGVAAAGASRKSPHKHDDDAEGSERALRRGHLTHKVEGRSCSWRSFWKFPEVFLQDQEESEAVSVGESAVPPGILTAGVVCPTQPAAKSPSSTGALSSSGPRPGALQRPGD